MHRYARIVRRIARWQENKGESWVWAFQSEWPEQLRPGAGFATPIRHLGAYCLNFVRSRFNGVS